MILGACAVPLEAKHQLTSKFVFDVGDRAFRAKSQARIEELALPLDSAKNPVVYPVV